MGKSTNPRPRATGNRSKGGRPKREGDRYPSGKLRPQKPNLRLIAVREAFGLTKLGEKFTPVEVAFQRSWINEETYRAAAIYAALYRLTVVGGPQLRTQADQSAPDGADVRDLSFAHLTNKEIAAIWDSALPVQRSPSDDTERHERATRRWMEINTAMTPDERQEVFNVAALDSWPQWILQRAAGHFDTSWERKRDLLIAGLQRRS